MSDGTFPGPPATPEIEKLQLVNGEIRNTPSNLFPLECTPFPRFVRFTRSGGQWVKGFRLTLFPEGTHGTTFPATVPWYIRLVGHGTFAFYHKGSANTADADASEGHGRRLLDGYRTGRFSTMPVQCKEPSRGVSLLAGKWTRKEQLQIVKLDSSWEIEFSLPLRTHASAATFFLDSHRIFARTWPFRNEREVFWQLVVIDLNSGSIDEQLIQSASASSPSKSIWQALQGEELLGLESFAQQSSRDFIIRVSLPTYSEDFRAPFRPDRMPSSRRGDTHVSADRTVFAYAVDNLVVCRRSTDLELLWTREIDAGMQWAFRLSVSANGDRVAAAVIDTSYEQRQRHLYISIHDGKQGTELMRLPVNGNKGIALSPDGNYLAVARQDRVRSYEVMDLSIDLYDVGSGQLLTSVFHQHYERGKSYGSGEFDWQGVKFSSNGEYLVSSANDLVKVWRFGP